MTDKLLYKVYEALVNLYNWLGAIIDGLEARLGLVDAPEPTIAVELEEYQRVDAA